MEKLVRDQIPQLMIEAGLEPKFRLAQHEERLLFLLQKVREEAAELEADPSIGELSDIYEVLEAVRMQLRISGEALSIARAEKVRERGAFNNGVILHLKS